MFDEALVKKDISKKEFSNAEPQLRAKLIEAQEILKHRPSQLIVVLEGNDRFAIRKVISRLHGWLDPRFLVTRVFQIKTNPKELKGPFFQRFWRAMPPKSAIGLYHRAWYANVIASQLDHTDEAKLDNRIRVINQYEKILYDDGAYILKFWLHQGKGNMKKELKKAKEDPDQYWWINKRDAEMLKFYSEIKEISEKVVSGSNQIEAPWVILDSTKEKYRDLVIGKKILESLESIIQKGDRDVQQRKDSIIRNETGPYIHGVTENVLEKLDLEQKLEKAEYKERMETSLSELSKLGNKIHKSGLGQIFVFEGWDSAGKGGAIRRLALGFDPFLYRIYPIAAPTDQEKGYHYLWRFWTRIPPRGFISIFDRSWYGRVLVEKVEGFAQPFEWQRAYNEINIFENQLVEDGFIIHKYWIHISKEEQLRRFKERELTPYKNFKITDEDYRNREKWNEYKDAVQEMVMNTSTPQAPWNLIPGNDKRFARVEVINRAIQRIKEYLT